MANYEDRGSILVGDLFIAKIESGVRGPIIGRVNSTEISITPPSTSTRSRMPRQRETHGQALDSVAMADAPASLSITYDSMNREMLAYALAGKLEDRATASGKVIIDSEGTDVTLVPLVQDEWVFVGYYNLSEVT